MAYHGTAGIRDDFADQGSILEFATFDKKFRGRVTRTSDSKVGFWFTDNMDRAVAAGIETADVQNQREGPRGRQYRNHILRTSLRIENPLVVDDIHGR